MTADGPVLAQERVLAQDLVLTADLAALTRREVADPGPLPGVPHFSDEEFDAIADAALERAPAGDLTVFAYGSLIWRPAFGFATQSRARLEGWQRRFVMRLLRYRGTVEQPGLMMALVPGGTCDGVAQMVPRAEARAAMRALVRREMSSKPATNTLSWVEVLAADGAGKIPALAIIASPAGRYYCGELPLEETAHILATACGHWGSGAEYLCDTVTSLATIGIRDDYLWRLQAAVAARIVAMQRATPRVSPSGFDPN